MKISNFSKWQSWQTRPRIHYPGVYALAISPSDLSNKPFTLMKEIVYFGMTNSAGGLWARLKQFDNTIIGKIGHGGAERFLFKYKNYEKLRKNLYVSINFLKCDPKSNKPEDLFKMGEVAKFEYTCFAEYAKQFGDMPEFNDKKRSPKRQCK
jgi:hypothetical protein